MIPEVGDVYCVDGHGAGMRTFAVYLPLQSVLSSSFDDYFIK